MYAIVIYGKANNCNTVSYLRICNMVSNYSRITLLRLRENNYDQLKGVKGLMKGIK